MSDATADETVLSPTALGGAAGLLSFGALAYVTLLLFDELAVAVVVGALSGLGSALVVPYSVQRSVEGYGPDRPANLERNVHSGAAGYALSTSGVTALAFLFVLDQPTVAVLVAVGVAAVEYVVLARVLPSADE